MLNALVTMSTGQDQTGCMQALIKQWLSNELAWHRSCQKAIHKTLIRNCSTSFMHLADVYCCVKLPAIIQECSYI